MRCLSTKYKIFLFALTDEKIPAEWINEIQPFCEKIEIHHLNKAGIFLRLAKGVFSAMPFQCLYYKSNWAAEKINNFVAASKPDKIIFQLVRTCVYATGFEETKCVIDFMDCMSYHYLLRSNKANFFEKFFYKKEYVRLKNFEQQLISRFKKIAVICEKDKALLPGNTNQVQVVPNGVVIPAVMQTEKTTDILFAGNLAYKPNIAAAVFLCRQVFPLLQKKIPAVKMVIAGANPAAKIFALKKEGIEIRGSFDNALALHQSARLFLAPMFLSTGIQNKILEAMANGLPVITTPQVVSAIGAVAGTHLFTALTAENFADEAEKLLLMPAKDRHVLQQNALQFVIENYNWKTNSFMLEKLF